MTLLPSVAGREVILGAGLNAAVYAATRVATGHPAPVVLEKELFVGSIFASAVNFRLQSANQASIASTASPGPTRYPSLSRADDLNYLPNTAFQIRDEAGPVEYPSSGDAARAVQRTLDRYAEVHTGAQIRFTREGVFTDKVTGEPLGTARRVIWAAGLRMPPGPVGSAITNADVFLRTPARDLADKRIALVGGGASAATIAEYMLGQGLNRPRTLPSSVHWYGGPAMPLTKDTWMSGQHARWAGIGRHLPQGGSLGVIRPYAINGIIVPAGEIAMVDDQVYDLVFNATGFKPVPCPVAQPSTYMLGGMPVARYDGLLAPKIFTIGAAADLSALTAYPSRFPDAAAAIYNLAPRTAALAASLPG